MMRFFFVAFIWSSYSLWSMQINPEDCVLNPIDILNHINSIDKENIDDNIIFRNPIPYYTRFMGLEGVVHLIAKINPFMKVLRHYQNTPFRKTLLSLLDSLSDKTKDSVMCEYLEFFDCIAPLYLQNPVDKILVAMRNKIYENTSVQIVSNDWMARVGVFRYCARCTKKGIAWTGYLSSFSIKKKEGPYSVNEALKENFDETEIPPHQGCCKFARQRFYLQEGSSLFFIANERPSTDKSISFSLEKLDLSDYILEKNRSQRYDLAGIVLSNFDQNNHFFSVLIKEDAENWFLYWAHYKIKAETQFIAAFAQKGFFSVLNYTMYPQRFIYVRCDED